VRNLICLLLLDCAALSAQIAPGDIVVAVHLPGLPATQLLAVDLVSASWRALPRFPADVMPPLAVAFDSVDDGLLLAVDAGGGISRVLRYDLRAGVPSNERALADVPGHVTDLALGAGHVLAAVDGPQGGVYALPRTGGPATLLLPLPGLTVLQCGGIDNSMVTAAWSAAPGPPPATPGAGIFDLAGSRFLFGPDNFINSLHPQLTGSVTLPFPQPRLLLAHGDGSIDYAQLTFGGGAQPVGVPVQPVLPAGGANTMKAGPGGSPLVLGGSSYPMLWTFSPAVSQPQQVVLAGPLPGDPVDFALAPDGSASLQWFGTACGPTAMDLLPQGRPTPGGVLQLQLSGGTANALAVLVLGLSDQLGGALPFQLPSGCELAVAPDVPLLHTTDAAGAAGQTLAVPNQNALTGLLVFAQWLQAPTLPFAVSRALSIRIGS
jgi:hypothetical protein